MNELNIQSGCLFLHLQPKRVTSVPSAKLFHICSARQAHINVQFLATAPYVVSHILHPSIAIWYIGLTGNYVDLCKFGGQIPSALKDNFNGPNGMGPQDQVFPLLLRVWLSPSHHFPIMTGRCWSTWPELLNIAHIHTAKP